MESTTARNALNLLVPAVSHNRDNSRSRKQISGKTPKALGVLLLIVVIFITFPSSNAAPPLLVSAKLESPVILDGRITSPNEWAESTPLDVNLALDLPAAPPFLSMRVWSKHDTNWIYFLYRIMWPASDVDPEDRAQIAYLWGKYKPPGSWDHSDMGSVSLAGVTFDGYGWDGKQWSTDVTAGGKNNVEGTGNYDGTYYWFEFRKALNSGDGYDWDFEPGGTYGLLDGSGSVYGGSIIMAFWDDSKEQAHMAQVSIQISTAAATTATTSAQTIIESTVTSALQTLSESTTGLEFMGQRPLGTLTILALAALVGIVSALLLKRRKARPRTPALKYETVQAPSVREAPSPARPGISTGYADLDAILAGGIPEGYSIMLLSPSYDERDLLLRRIIESAIKSGRATFYVSGDVARTQTLVGRYARDFYAFSPQADRIAPAPANLYKIPGIESLSELNISLTKIMEGLTKGAARKIIILDILSDVLLHHKALTTRKWLSDFVAKRKAEGFTTLATLNPLIAAKEETQTIIDVFDGVIEVYEKEIRERTRRFLVIRKMYDRKYSDTELMLDKDKLF